MDTGSSRPRLRRTLTMEHWPAADRLAWIAACQPSVRLHRGGAAAHLKVVSQGDLAKRYGLFLGYLLRLGRLDEAAAAGAHVTPANIAAYIDDLNRRVSSVTAYNCIHNVRRITNLIAPEHDVAWLKDSENDLAFAMRPRSKAGRFVLTKVLSAAGFTLMAEAEASNQPLLTRARHYRNGLMIALLAYVPIRLKNFAALELGRTIVKVKETWWIVLPASETKEARHDERPVDERVGVALERYLSFYRPVLARTEKPPFALWLSSRDGTPLSYAAVESIITETTRSATGVSVSPHLFRTAGVSTAALECPENPYFGSALLHHHDPRTAVNSYNRAGVLSAGLTYQRIINDYSSDEG